MENSVFENYPHKRYNPLTDSWVLVSPHRTKRPWQGQVEKTVEDNRPAHDPTCYLCANNVRSNGEQNPDYQDVFAFTNDFSALLEEVPFEKTTEDNLFQSVTEQGLCKVICFSPRHDLTIPEMDESAIRKVVDLWCTEYQELGDKDFIQYVQIFENKGFVMGCSNPHPHGQIWASSSIPDEPFKKQAHQLTYFEKYGRTILSDYLEKELDKKERILFENAHLVGLVPFWATWPFETMIIPKRAMARITEMTNDEKQALANAYKHLTVLYDNLFQTSFPYSAGIHQAPTDGNAHSEWHWHMSFYPPLLRSATVKKFMVGYEMFALPQRDITPEKAADMLRSQSTIHFKHPSV